ncbi:predicted protein [Chaetomium globosum CBS 148.51]|uniref:Uncharacterized protein n=1 Tax=Chaetomium globosum (strain ATCC 6205 / CBS 148.51 / DSM 1962 / NBRC 6347 / NRRL 1970) TaxID=306901 RepID=Q2HDL5_CHAGB|nr:uncharacterized protein CHGG_01689 [Chaetomium globosum CBS 148.51]EAQ93454.1 predicted protein [Chaetomium globosum CBS 148.51]
MGYRKARALPRWCEPEARTVDFLTGVVQRTWAPTQWSDHYPPIQNQAVPVLGVKPRVQGSAGFAQQKKVREAVWGSRKIPNERGWLGERSCARNSQSRENYELPCLEEAPRIVPRLSVAQCAVCLSGVIAGFPSFPPQAVPMAWVRCQQGPGSSRSRSRIRRWHSTLPTWKVLSMPTQTPAQHHPLTSASSQLLQPDNLKHSYKGAILINDPASVARLWATFRAAICEYGFPGPALAKRTTEIDVPSLSALSKTQAPSGKELECGAPPNLLRSVQIAQCHSAALGWETHAADGIPWLSSLTYAVLLRLLPLSCLASLDEQQRTVQRPANFAQKDGPVLSQGCPCTQSTALASGQSVTAT